MTRKAVKTTAMIGANGLTTQRVVSPGSEDLTDMVPIARAFALEDWRSALDISLSGKAHGKLVLLPSSCLFKLTP